MGVSPTHDACGVGRCEAGEDRRAILPHPLDGFQMPAGMQLTIARPHGVQAERVMGGFRRHQPRLFALHFGLQVGVVQIRSLVAISAHDLLRQRHQGIGPIP